MSPFITLIIVIALMGLIVWAVTYFIPMPEKFKVAIYVVAGVCLLLYLLSFFGLFSLSDLRGSHHR